MTILIQGLTFVLQAFLIIVLIRVVFSFVSPFPTNPLSRLAWQVTEPVLAPIRRLLPPMGGIDLSPMVVGIGAIILISVLNNLAGP
ncbi:MAG: YggT family protein [Chloroflexi bacterium]|nr:MAG: YggT family protein [Chloroflexota bacterium]